jgi:short-subunit dehydrogenase
MTSVLITGPTRGLGRATVRALASHPARPDLLLVGRGGADLTRVADEARALGVTAHEIDCDLSHLSAVRAAVIPACKDRAPCRRVSLRAGDVQR